MRTLLITLFCCCIVLPAAVQGQVSPPGPADAPPAAPREFRGAWVSSVNNGNWPSKAGLSVAQQQQEMISILDDAKRTNLNAVVFQVRPAGDALYQSNLEPWSEYLTGVQG